MHTASYEFLMKPDESAGCHQTLSSRVRSGDETNYTPSVTCVNSCKCVTYLLHVAELVAEDSLGSLNKRGGVSFTMRAVNQLEERYYHVLWGGQESGVRRRGGGERGRRGGEEGEEGSERLSGGRRERKEVKRRTRKWLDVISRSHNRPGQGDW